jgi:hypothetical protein
MVDKGLVKVRLDQVLRGQIGLDRKCADYSRQAVRLAAD